MLVRDIPFVVNAFPERLMVTCSDYLSTTATTGAVGLRGSQTTADVVAIGAAETTVFGRVIDRLRQPLGPLYLAAVAQAYIHSTRGSTEADRKLTIGIRMQHGDSSGGGDMVDFSTGSTPATRTWFSTGRTSDMSVWDGTESTGEVYAASNPGVYPLIGAKRFVRVAIPVFKDKVTTESSGDDQARVGGTIAFMAGDKVPARTDSTSPYSTTTSTAL